MSAFFVELSAMHWRILELLELFGPNKAAEELASRREPRGGGGSGGGQVQVRGRG